MAGRDAPSFLYQKTDTLDRLLETTPAGLRDAVRALADEASRDYLRGRELVGPHHTLDTALLPAGAAPAASGVQVGAERDERATSDAT